MHQGNLPDSSVIRYVSQTYLPQPFGLSFSKPGHSLRAALRQAQGERVYLRYVANQAILAASASESCLDSYMFNSTSSAFNNTWLRLLELADEAGAVPRLRAEAGSRPACE